jgi:glycosyltransferase involved in cell wall biosynthesis
VSQPLVSLTIITYNQASLIRATLDSAVSHDYERLEVVVADDGSTDGTVDILREYERRHPGRVRVVTGPNLGITGNSNRALWACQGELIAFLGGDDLLLPGKIAAQVAWLNASRDRVLCGHDVEHFSSETGDRVLLHSQLTRLHQGVGPRPFIEMGSLFAAISVMVKRAAVPAYGFDERLPSVSDGKLWIDTTMKGGAFGYVPGVLARYRRDASSITRSNHEGVLKQEYQLLDIVESEHPELTGACRRGRARLHRREGIAALLANSPEVARRELLESLRLNPLASAKTPIWLGLSYAPSRARGGLRSLAAQVGKVRSRLLHGHKRSPA